MRFVAAMAVLFSVGCGGETVEVELNFPSEDAFVRVNTARVYVVSVSREQLGSCPDLIAQAEVGVLDEAAVMDTGQQNVCEFQARRVRLPDVGEGLKAYVAVGLSDGGEVWLAGCTMSDVYIDAHPLTITLAPTEQYRSDFGAGSPRPACTADAKCQLGCT